jgi:hypothetical protein
MHRPATFVLHEGRWVDPFVISGLGLLFARVVVRCRGLVVAVVTVASSLVLFLCVNELRGCTALGLEQVGAVASLDLLREHLLDDAFDNRRCHR